MPESWMVFDNKHSGVGTQAFQSLSGINQKGKFFRLGLREKLNAIRGRNEGKNGLRQGATGLWFVPVSSDSIQVSPPTGLGFISSRTHPSGDRALHALPPPEVG